MAVELLPRSPDFVPVVHTTGGLPLIEHGLLTVNNSRKTVLQTLVTEKQSQLTFSCHWTVSGETTNTLTHLMSPCCTERQLNHNLMYTMDHTFGYHSKKFIHACLKLSVHAHGTEIRGGNFKQFKTSIGHAM